ncbi:hypothetical protein LBMAG53_31210 [Planctomycetota bacterium]|nr:hypothetical protein LBMAG53_31210 [Planctomycetota bacterium]
MRIGHQESEELLEMNLVPLIDCMFFLLVFFLATAAIRKKNEDVALELPVVHAAAVKRKCADGARIVTIYVDPTDSSKALFRLKTMKDSMVTHGGRRDEITWSALISELRKLAGTKVEVRIDADQRVPVRIVSQLIDHLQLYGIHFGLRTADQRT